MRLATLAVVLTFAGSIAGFHLASAPGAPGRDLGASPAAGTEQVVRVDVRCPKELSARADRRA
jgi:hypothetical protein